MDKNEFYNIMRFLIFVATLGLILYGCDRLDLENKKLEKQIEQSK